MLRDGRSANRRTRISNAHGSLGAAENLQLVVPEDSGQRVSLYSQEIHAALEKKGIFTKKSSVMFYLGVTVKQEIQDEFDDDMAAAESKGRSKL